MCYNPVVSNKWFISAQAREEIIKAHLDGVNATTIAAERGKDPKVIKRVLEKAGVYKPMAGNQVPLQEKEKMLEEYLVEGVSPNKIANRRGMSRTSVVAMLKKEEVHNKIKNRATKYVDKLFNTRERALSRLLDQVENNITIVEKDGDIHVVSTLPVKELIRMFGKIDEAIERHHKISAGYYISHDVLKTKILPALLASIKRHVKDQEAIAAIAADMASLTLEE